MSNQELSPLQKTTALMAARDALNQSLSVDAVQTALTSIQDLITHFPLPGLILGKDGAVLFENSQMSRRVARSWLTAHASRLLALAANEQACIMDALAPDGSSHSVAAYATPLNDQIVVVFDDRSGNSRDEASALQKRITELEKISVTDRLTGLWNRRHFDQVIEREMQFSERERSPLSLLMFDLDFFKSVNDRFGHHVGDAVLQTTAERLRQASRPTDLLFRWGGEEFALLAPATSVTAATTLAGRLRQNVAAAPFEVAGPITVSVGVAERRRAESSGDWFARADAALYQSKSNGRNRVTAAAGSASQDWQQEAQTSALRLVWSDQYVSGHTLIDAEHHKLFDATNDLIAAMTDKQLASGAVLAQVDQLLADVAQHFIDEEQVLEGIGYPRWDDHRRLHRKLLDGAQHLRDAVHSDASSVGEVVEFLAYEVVNRHILKEDRHYFPYLAAAASR